MVANASLVVYPVRGLSVIVRDAGPEIHAKTIRTHVRVHRVRTVARVQLIVRALHIPAYVTAAFLVCSVKHVSIDNQQYSNRRHKYHMCMGN